MDCGQGFIRKELQREARVSFGRNYKGKLQCHLEGLKKGSWCFVLKELKREAQVSFGRHYKKKLKFHLEGITKGSSSLSLKELRREAYSKSGLDAEFFGQRAGSKEGNFSRIFFRKVRVCKELRREGFRKVGGAFTKNFERNLFRGWGFIYKE